MPLSHRPGHARVDFGETLGVIGGVERKIHFYVMSLPHSDAVFVKGYPAETTEAFCDGHVSAFSFFGGIPQSIFYDNTKIAVARILGKGRMGSPRGEVRASPRRSHTAPDPSTHINKKVLCTGMFRSRAHSPTVAKELQTRKLVGSIVGARHLWCIC